MSPEAGAVLMEQVAPRLRSAVPYIKPVGCEDSEELYQDGLAMAAKLLHDLEQRGKQVTPGNVSYYIILHLKSGRRSYGTSRTDAMFASTQLGGRSSVLSLETEVGYDPELDEPIRLEQMLSCSLDDPAMAAGRNLDWEAFIQSHDYRFGVILQEVAEGRTVVDAAKELQMGYSSTVALKNRLREELQEYLGEEALADSTRNPSWRANLLVDREKAACRAERRHGALH